MLAPPRLRRLPCVRNLGRDCTRVAFVPRSTPRAPARLRRVSLACVTAPAVARAPASSFGCVRWAFCRTLWCSQESLFRIECSFDRWSNYGHRSWRTIVEISGIS